jgi:hypothetical protein|tara:strand:- start:293 stop:427 length:135 start_codon:yes stop_codon:yes gene_type:complete
VAEEASAKMLEIHKIAMQAVAAVLEEALAVEGGSALILAKMQAH